MELGGWMTYHAKAVPIRDKKINEHERLPHRPNHLGVLVTGQCCESPFVADILDIDILLLFSNDGKLRATDFSNECVNFLIDSSNPPIYFLFDSLADLHTV
jgi:hypothetical protein